MLWLGEVPLVLSDNTNGPVNYLPNRVVRRRSITCALELRYGIRHMRRSYQHAVSEKLGLDVFAAVGMRELLYGSSVLLPQR